jgi:hypothetical protein
VDGPIEFPIYHVHPQFRLSFARAYHDDVGCRGHALREPDESVEKKFVILHRNQPSYDADHRSLGFDSDLLANPLASFRPIHIRKALEIQPQRNHRKAALVRQI